MKYQERYNRAMSEMLTGDDAVPQEPMKEFFVFELDGELYAVLIEEVDHVMKIPPVTSVPNAPRAIVGIFHLRGKVVVAIDLIRRMNLERNKPLTAGHLFIAHHGKNLFAIFVDKPKTIARIPVSAIHDANPLIQAHVPPQYSKGVFLYVVAPAPVRREPSFMIEAGQGTKDTPAIPSLERPVLWLNLEKLLDQEDLMTLFA